MANVLVRESSLQSIADAIRGKNGTENTYKPSQMAEAIEAISGGGGITPTGTKQISIISNGTTTEDVTDYAHAEITVNVPSSGGGYTFDWASSSQVITIGANSVTNTQEAKSYFESYTYDYVLILSPLTVNNQFVGFSTTLPLRYKNGAIVNTVVGTNYDCALVEGTQYLILSK